MKISRDEVMHIALLARLGISDDEAEAMSEQLSNILENFEILQQVDTTDILPTAQPIALQNITAEDRPAESMTPDRVLSNAPEKEEDFFKVKAVLEESN